MEINKKRVGKTGQRYKRSAYGRIGKYKYGESFVLI
jgi:hypothetical protein